MTEPTLAQIECCAEMIYDRVRTMILPVPFRDLGTEREAQHRHIGSAAIREGLYSLVRDLAAVLR